MREEEEVRLSASMAQGSESDEMMDVEVGESVSAPVGIHIHFYK